MTFDAPTAQLLSALFSAMQQRRWRDRIDELIAETERTGKVPHVVFSVRHDYVRVFDANAGRPRSEPSKSRPIVRRPARLIRGNAARIAEVAASGV